jgi:hypothetical protein
VTADARATLASASPSNAAPPRPQIVLRHLAPTAPTTIHPAQRAAAYGFVPGGTSKVGSLPPRSLDQPHDLMRNCANWRPISRPRGLPPVTRVARTTPADLDLVPDSIVPVPAYSRARALDLGFQFTEGQLDALPA